MPFTTRRKELQAKLSTGNLRAGSPAPPSPEKSTTPPLPQRSFAGVGAGGGSVSPVMPQDAPFMVERAWRGDGDKIVERSEVVGLGLGIASSASGSSTATASSSSGGGFAKLLSLGRKGDKKQQQQQQQQPQQHSQSSPTLYDPPSPRLANFPSPPSLPFAFPPTSTQRSLPPLPPTTPPHKPSPKPHASQFIAPHVIVPPSDSSSTIASSSSSFASTGIFTTDDWETGSEATSLSLTSSPDSTKDAGAEYQQRMWRVKGLGDSPLKTDISNLVVGPRGRAISGGALGGPGDSEAEELAYSRSSSRNSTPVPSFLVTMLADPATPPRPKRFSASSTKPSPTSPPFDPQFEKAAKALRESEMTPTPPASPESSRDADDEVSPPRVVMRTRRSEKQIEQMASAAVLAGKDRDSLLPTDEVYKSKARIPSMRFEGISMDAMFAEVEKKMKSEEERELREQREAREQKEQRPPAMSEEKKARRRTRVYSLYRPGEQSSLSSLSSSSTVASTSSSTSSTSTADVASPSTSITSLASSERGGPLPRPLPRRVSSRPSPLNVEAANAVPTFRRVNSPRSPSTAGTITSPRKGVFSPRPDAPPSPRLDPAFTQSLASPTFTTPGPMSPTFNPTSPNLGDAFYSPMPSPALSTTSTFRGVELPEVCVRPPTPPAVEEDKEARVKSFSSTQASVTKVVILEPKRTVKLSTRTSTAPKRVEQRRVAQDGDTPPLSPALSTASTVSSAGGLDSPSSPTDVGLFPASHSPEKRNSLYNSEEDATDVEDALNKMLLRLGQPHTPPASPSRTAEPRRQSRALTARALEKHTSAQTPISLIGRSVSHPVQVSPEGDFQAMETKPLTLTSSSSFVAGLANESDAEGGRIAGGKNGHVSQDESDDSMGRYGDASSGEEVRFQVIGSFRPSASKLAAMAKEPEAAEQEEEEDDIVSLPDGFTVTPPTPAQSSSGFSSASSSCSSIASLSRPVPHSFAKRVVSQRHRDSAATESTSTDSETDGYDSQDGAVVMMGERVSCGYTIGVAF